MALPFVYKIYSSKMDSSTYSKCQFNLTLLGNMKFPSHLPYWKLLKCCSLREFHLGIVAWYVLI